MQAALQTTPAARLRICGTAGEQLRRTIRQISFHGILPLVEGRHLTQQFHRFELIHRSGIGLITGPHGITRQAEQVVDAQGMGPQQIRLQRQTIAIPTCQLQHRLQASIQQQTADRQAAHPHHRTTAIGDIDGMHPPLELVRHGQRVGGISPPGGHHLRRHRLLTGLNRALERRRQTLNCRWGPLCRIRSSNGTTMSRKGG